MLEQVVNTLTDFNKEVAVLTLAALPVSELRGAIPLGLAMGFAPVKALTLSLIGNLLPVIPLLFLLQPVARILRHIKFFEHFFDWLFARTRKRAALIEKFEALGLILFVAIPLPVTGAWTGCVAATLFKVRFRYAFLSICLGVLIAASIVLGLSMAGIEIFNKHFAVNAT